LTPSSPITSYRIFDKDIEVGGFTIPKETKVMFGTSAIQNDSKYVEDVSDYKPERWLDEAVKARQGTEKEKIDHKIISKPFGFGQRMCLGARVAEMEMKVFVMHLLRDWNFKLSPPNQPYQVVYGTMSKASPFPIIEFESLNKK